MTKYPENSDVWEWLWTHSKPLIKNIYHVNYDMYFLYGYCMIYYFAFYVYPISNIIHGRFWYQFWWYRLNNERTLSLVNDINSRLLNWLMTSLLLEFIPKKQQHFFKGGLWFQWYAMLSVMGIWCSLIEILPLRNSMEK